MQRKKSKFKLIKTLLKLSVILSIFATLTVTGVFMYYAKDLPSPESINNLNIAESTKIYDRTGKVLLYDIHGEQKRTIVPFDDIPKYAKQATIVAEDNSFYEHFGIDARGIARAMLKNLRVAGVSQGGSTITQQLIKHVYLSPERTIPRKVKEIILAIEMEFKYSKDEILDFYLNIVPYGSNVYGIEAASQMFFNKPAKDLTLAESAILASLLKGTTYYSPFGNNPDKLKERQEYILNRMYSLGYIEQDELDTALLENIKYQSNTTGINAPHFVMYVREYLANKYGEDTLKVSGFNVITTLDWELQQEAERIIKESAERNEKSYDAENAALVAIDPTTGHILAMVGSRNYFDQEIDGNVNVAIRPRQPGSSFKPFAYAKAFEKGYTPDTVVYDVETNFGVFGAKEYTPHNYTEKFVGPITLKEALAQSINVPAVKILYLVGVKDTINLAKSMGITTLKNPDTYGLALVLGGGEVTLLDETSAYGVFSQDGVRNPPIVVLSVTSHGKTIEEFKTMPIQVIQPQIARLITAILSNNDLRAPLFGTNSYLNLANIPAAVKTGTTQEFRDAWTIGYTKDIVVGVWAGNNDNSPTKAGGGSRTASPIWSEFMKTTYKVKQWRPKNFDPPNPIITGKPILNGLAGGSQIVNTDAISGKLATEYTPPELIKQKVYYTEPHSILFFVDKDDPQGENPSNPAKDPQFSLWEEAINKWVETVKNDPEQNLKYEFLDPPQEFDDVHTPQNMPFISLFSPSRNQNVSKGETLNVIFDLKNNYPIQKIEILFNSELLKTLSSLSIQNRMYSTDIQIPFNVNIKDVNSLKIKVIDTVLNKKEVDVPIFVN